VHDDAVTEAVVFLVRHASAGDASTWRGADADRPLDERGREQAREIAGLLPSYRPVKVISAPPVRCVDTVSAVAEAVGVPLEIDPLFGEDEAPADPERHLLEVVVPGAAVVVCSQGGVIPRILLALTGRHERARKGSVWMLTFEGEALASAELLR
jgi:phosphohistidine phosphatase SixA